MNILALTVQLLVAIAGIVHSFSVHRQPSKPKREPTLQSSTANYTQTGYHHPLFRSISNGISRRTRSIRHRRAAGAYVTEFIMGRDLDAVIPWNEVDAKSKHMIHESMAAFGIVNDTQIPPCPSKVSSESGDRVYKRSTCPWFYAKDHDPNRFPTTVLKAVTLCEDACIGSDGTRQCVPITRISTVLHKSTVTLPDGNYKWTESEMSVTVGYTCAGRRLVNTAETGTPIPLYE